MKSALLSPTRGTSPGGSPRRGGGSPLRYGGLQGGLHRHLNLARIGSRTYFSFLRYVSYHSTIRLYMSRRSSLEFGPPWAPSR